MNKLSYAKDFQNYKDIMYYEAHEGNKIKRIAVDEHDDKLRIRMFVSERKKRCSDGKWLYNHSVKDTALVDNPDMTPRNKHDIIKRNMELSVAINKLYKNYFNESKVQ